MMDSCQPDASCPLVITNDRSQRFTFITRIVMFFLFLFFKVQTRLLILPPGFIYCFINCRNSLYIHNFSWADMLISRRKAARLAQCATPIGFQFDKTLAVCGWRAAVSDCLGSTSPHHTCWIPFITYNHNFLSRKLKLSMSLFMHSCKFNWYVSPINI